MTRPWFQFYGRDWLDNKELRRCSPLSRSVLADLMCLAHEGETYGYLADKIGPLTAEYMASRCVVSLKNFRSAIVELKLHERIHETDAGILYVKRMVEDEDVRVRRAAGGSASIGHPNTPPKKPKKGYPYLEIDSRAHPRADSDSDSKKETSLPENSPAGRHIADWVHLLYGRHPKKKNRPVVESFLVGLLDNWQARAKRAGVSTRDELFLQIDEAHKAACLSLDWTKERGQYCPTLDKWLDDEGYTAHGARASPAEKLPPDPPSQIEIWRREKAAVEARGEVY